MSKSHLFNVLSSDPFLTVDNLLLLYSNSVFIQYGSITFDLFKFHIKKSALLLFLLSNYQYGAYFGSFFNANAPYLAAAG